MSVPCVSRDGYVVRECAGGCVPPLLPEDSQTERAVSVGSLRIAHDGVRERQTGIHCQLYFHPYNYRAPLDNPRPQWRIKIDWEKKNAIIKQAFSFAL